MTKYGLTASLLAGGPFFRRCFAGDNRVMSKFHSIRINNSVCTLFFLYKMLLKWYHKADLYNTNGKVNTAESERSNMAGQNIYDNEPFYEGYKQIREKKSKSDEGGRRI